MYVYIYTLLNNFQSSSTDSSGAYTYACSVCMSILRQGEDGQQNMTNVNFYIKTCPRLCFQILNSFFD